MFAGDAGSAMELEPGVAMNGQFIALADGDALPLVAPPQGGHVAFVAVRARNVSTCPARITATLRSQTTALVAGQDARDVTLVAESDGWAAPNAADVSRVANVPLCPDYFDESIVDVPHKLEVRLEDSRGAGAAGQIERTVVPRCLQEDPAELARCRCECTAGYRLGGCAVALDAATGG
jgi:hypothetical protein